MTRKHHVYLDLTTGLPRMLPVLSADHSGFMLRWLWLTMGWETWREG